MKQLREIDFGNSRRYKDTKANYCHLLRLFFYVSPSRVSNPAFHGIQQKKKENYQQVLFHRQISIYYSLDVKNEGEMQVQYLSQEMWTTAECLHFLHFGIKTLQTAVSTSELLSNGSCACVLFFFPLYGSFLAFTMSHCLDKKHLCRLGIVGAS